MTVQNKCEADPFLVPMRRNSCVLIMRAVLVLALTLCATMASHASQELKVVPAPTRNRSTAASAVAEVPIPHAMYRTEKDDHAAADEASEYWLICGRRVKITDSLLALFTFFLVVIGAWQGKKLQETVTLAREEFTAAHRPRLRVRRLVIKNGDLITRPKIEVTNIGETSAEIVDSHLQLVHAADQSGALNDFSDNTPSNSFSTLKKPLAGGESLEVEALPFTEDLQRTLLKHHGSGGYGDLYAIGWLRYRDNNKTVRRTGFFRRRDPVTGIFHAPKNAIPDYEYED